MPSEITRAAAPPTYLVVHPGAELFGSDRMTLESVIGLRASGARVVVALPENGALVDELARAGASVVIVPMLVLRKSLLHPRSWGRLISLTLRGFGAGWRLLRRQRPDAVYVSTITIPQWPLLARLRRIPVVSHVHEAEASGSRSVNAILYAPHLAATEILVNSEFSLSTIRAALPRAARHARVVYNGVAGPDQPQEARPEIDELRVLYVGRLSPRKGVADLLHAARLLQDRGARVHVSLLGSVFPGYEWFEDEIRALAAEPLSPPIEFLGFQPDIWDVLAAHDVLVVPSRLDEPFGNTAVEGILARRPVIASDTSGLREAAGGYETTLFVPAGDPASIADALGSVISDWSALRDGLAASARRAGERHAPSAYRERVSSAVARAAGSERTARGRRPAP